MIVNNGILVGPVIGSTGAIIDDESAANPKALVFGIIDADDTPTTEYQNYKFIQTEELTREGIAVHPWGGIVVPYLSGGDDPGSRRDKNVRGPVPSGTPTGSEFIVIEFNEKQYGCALSALLEGTVGSVLIFEEMTDSDDNNDDNNRKS